jgi:hypothetical protein
MQVVGVLFEESKSFIPGQKLFQKQLEKIKHLLYFCELSSSSPVIFPKQRMCSRKVNKISPPGKEN